MRRHPLLVSLLAVSLVAAAGIDQSMAGKTIRGHKVHGGHRSYYGGHHHSHGGHYYRPRTYVSVGFGYYGYYGYPYYGYYPYPAYAAPVYTRVLTSPVAYLDTDVSPEDAAVFIDGDYVGIADNFDGFPRYLTVTPGRHTVTFKFDGYRTWTRTIRVPAGGITRLKFELTVGEGVDEGEPGEFASEEEDAYPIHREESRGEIELAPDVVGDPGFLRLSVSPPEATVYLDGEFYAPASTLARLHGDLRLDSGVHVIEVVMPGYETSTRRIELAPGDRLTLSIELRKSEP